MNLDEIKELAKCGRKMSELQWITNVVNMVGRTDNPPRYFQTYLSKLEEKKLETGSYKDLIRRPEYEALMSQRCCEAFQETFAPYLKE